MSTETIVALSTPPGVAALAVIRLSGPESHAIIGNLVTAKVDATLRAQLKLPAGVGLVMTETARLAGTRPEIDHEVRATNRVFIVLDDQHSVTEISKLLERTEQAIVISRV